MPMAKRTALSMKIEDYDMGLAVVAVSDTHTLFGRIKLPKGDLLIHAGDACSYGNEQEFRTFACQFREAPFKYRIFVAGNHDRFVESNRHDAIEMLGKDVIYLQDEQCSIEGYNIYGSPWVPAFCNWAFNADERQLELAADAVPEGLDILVTHGPPYGLMDDGLRFGYLHTHIGSQPLARKLLKLHEKDESPYLHIFGHNHCGYGVALDNGVLVANVAQVNEEYKLVHPPIVFNL